ncbi:DUF6232 family protein [Saccharothrix variisporea]|uniref:Uncharacterized protein n=1 Tax=Saccharothrix variisporea TaxID=543527 RepID=A0A495XAH5_9PSEU|nr:DUF6232 family protein [Saccharothrix variisporea]RKT71270.1 hypothetical protein DFJ66_4552 [Saccharothrix variisporea]
MVKEEIGAIVVSPRLLRIAHQAYPLANISRVQTLRLRWTGKDATAYPLREVFGLALLVALVGAALAGVVPELGLDRDVRVLVERFAAALAIVVAVRVVYLLVLVVRRLFRRRQYVLVIETAGTQVTALTSTDREEIFAIERQVVGYIENPPKDQRVIKVKNVYNGHRIGKGAHVGGSLGDVVGRDKVGS